MAELPVNLDSPGTRNAVPAPGARLAAAYVKAWGEISNVVKNSKNPHLGNDYADLAAVLDTVKQTFARHELAVIQAPGPLSGDGTRITLISLLIHSSGESMRFVHEAPCGTPPAKGSKEPGPPTAQSIGSATTYLRRYAMLAIAGIAPVDDDGNEASGRVQPEPTVDTSQLLAQIAVAAKSLDKAALEALKPAVEAANDSDVTKSFIDARLEIKKSAKSK